MALQLSETNSLEDTAKIYLGWAPMSLAIREITRIKVLKLLDEKERIFTAKKILDVGCGDGKWWTHVIPNDLQKVHGLDISTREISLATNIISAQCLDITSPKLIDELTYNRFDLIIGNCSLEHVFHIDKALKNIYSLLEEGGTFILLVPTPYWALKGKSVGLMNRISPRLSMSFSGLMNGFFQHWHLYNYSIWTSLLNNFNFKVKDVYGIGNNKSEFLFRLGLPTAFFSFIVKCITGKYLNHFLSAVLPDSITKKAAKNICDHLDNELKGPESEDIFEYMIVCKK